jgi:putative salt-induced outer membrane protein YdiY
MVCTAGVSSIWSPTQSADLRADARKRPKLVPTSRLSELVTAFRLVVAAMALALTPWLSYAGQTPAEQERDALVAALREREARLVAAIADKDREQLEALAWPEFTFPQQPGIDRNSWIQDILNLCGGGRTEIHDLNVEPSQNSAIATMSVTVHRDPACQPPSTNGVITDVWVQRDGEWRLLLRYLGPSAAPDANAPPPAEVRPSSPQFAGNAELSLLLTSGNIETQSIGFASELRWQRGPWRMVAKTAIVRTTTGGQQRARSINVEVREARALRPSLDLTGRVLYQRDLFAGMLHRYGGDLGIGVRFSYHGHSLETSIAAGSTRELRLTGTDGTFPIASLGLHYRWAVNSSMSLADDSTVTDSLTEFNNWRVENTASVSASLIRPVSLKLSFASKYLRKPVPGFERTDTVLSAAVVARF